MYGGCGLQIPKGLSSHDHFLSVSEVPGINVAIYAYYLRIIILHTPVRPSRLYRLYNTRAGYLLYYYYTDRRKSAIISQRSERVFVQKGAMCSPPIERLLSAGFNASVKLFGSFTLGGDTRVHNIIYNNIGVLDRGRRR